MSMDKASSNPLYEQIKEYILNGIQQGLFQPHQKIPSGVVSQFLVT